MTLRQATGSNSVHNSKPSAKGISKETRGSRIPRHAWIQVGTGAVFLFLLFLFLGLKAWSWISNSNSLEPTAGGVFLLVNQNSGRCLSVKDGSTSPGAPIVQGPTPDGAGASERWILIQVSSNVFRLQNENSQKVLEIPGASMDKGVQAIQWHEGFAQSKHQHWEFERVGESYVLRVRHSQLVLAIGQGRKEEGARAIQWDYVRDVPDQLWKLQAPNP